MDGIGRGASMKILGSGALNLDMIWMVEDMSLLNREGFAFSPGAESSGNRSDLDRLLGILGEKGRLIYSGGGGSAANTISVLSALGWDTSFVGVAGAGDTGNRVLESMDGVDVSLVRREGEGAVCLVLLEQRTMDRAMFVVPNKEVDPGPGVFSRLVSFRLVHMSSLVPGGGMEFQMELASRLDSGQILSLDPGEIYASRGLRRLGPLLARIDLLFITEQELALLTGEADESRAVRMILEVMESGGDPGSRSKKDIMWVIAATKAIFLKRGKAGASLFTRNVRIDRQAEEVADVVDNTGAGDAFDAGVIDGLLRGLGPEQILDGANSLAGLSLKGLGREWIHGDLIKDWRENQNHRGGGKVE